MSVPQTSRRLLTGANDELRLVIQVAVGLIIGAAIVLAASHVVLGLGLGQGPGICVLPDGATQVPVPASAPPRVPG